VGWRQIVENMYKNASVAEWYRQNGKHAVYANPKKAVPLPEGAQAVALKIPRNGRLVEWRGSPGPVFEGAGVRDLVGAPRSSES
jgi:hypothetical protein